MFCAWSEKILKTWGNLFSIKIAGGRPTLDQECGVNNIPLFDDYQIWKLIMHSKELFIHSKHSKICGGTICNFNFHYYNWLDWFTNYNLKGKHG